ncbi:MAG: energy transducer TonB [Rhizomicrobium sp.]
MAILGRARIQSTRSSIFFLCVLAYFAWIGSVLAEGTTPSVPPASCDSLYSQRNDLHPVTGLLATIRLDESLGDIQVAESSGFPDLDKAAVICAASTKYKAATVDGKPVEIRWSFRMAWNAYRGHSFISIPRTPLSCEPFYPGSAVRTHTEGNTLLMFHVMPDGTVQQPTVLQSSGSNDLDNAAKTCVLGWHYPPATLDGKPAEFEWKSWVSWHLWP